MLAQAGDSWRALCFNKKNMEKFITKNNLIAIGVVLVMFRLLFPVLECRLPTSAEGISYSPILCPRGQIVSLAMQPPTINHIGYGENIAVSFYKPSVPLTLLQTIIILTLVGAGWAMMRNKKNFND
jgi:hypothetical protein